MSPVWIEPVDRIDQEAIRLYPAENLLAAVLSIVLPGSGHLVKAGGSNLQRPWRTIGIAWTIFSLAFYAALIVFRVAADARLYLLTAIAALLLSCAAVYDCCLRGTPHSAIRKLGFFALAVLASIIWVNAICYWCSLAAGFRYMQNASQSMQPTIPRDAMVVVDWNYYRDHKPQFGDLVVAYHVYQSSGTGNYIFKRLIGIGGDTVQMSAGKLIRNGVPLEENYVVREGLETLPWMDNMPARKIPAGGLFLLGDNRHLSLDSRAPEIGNFHESELRGKVVRVAKWF